MSGHRDVFAAIERATGVDPNSVREERLRWYLFNGAVMVSTPPAWKRPKDIEEELEGIRSDIRALKKRIQDADRIAMASARREATRPNLEALEAEIEAAQGDHEIIRRATDKYFVKERTITPSMYVDKAAIKHLEELEMCLVRPIEAAIEAAPKGRGRPKNSRAHAIASYAAHSYLNLTGEKPTFWNGTDNAFSILVEELFNVGSVIADIRKPIEAAMSKLDQGGGI